MEDIRKKCDHCENFSNIRIKQEDGEIVHLCAYHEKQLKEHIRNKYKKVNE